MSIVSVLGDVLGLKGRWHDARRTFITELVEPGAGNEVIRDIVDRVSDHMLRHYSHIRQAAKKAAVNDAMISRKESTAGETFYRSHYSRAG